MANRVARALDAIDDAVTRADRIARQMAGPTQVQESVQRMKEQRRDLLIGLTTAVDEIGEIYAKLLELSTTTDLLGMHTDEFNGATQVSQSLDVIRGVRRPRCIRAVGPQRQPPPSMTTVKTVPSTHPPCSRRNWCSGVGARLFRGS